VPPHPAVLPLRPCPGAVLLRRCLDESDLGQPVIRALSPDSLPVSAHLRRVSPGHLEVQPAYPRPGGGNTVTSVRSGDSAGTGGISAFFLIRLKADRLHPDLVHHIPDLLPGGQPVAEGGGAARGHPPLKGLNKILLLPQAGEE